MKGSWTEPAGAWPNFASWRFNPQIQLRARASRDDSPDHPPDAREAASNQTGITDRRANVLLVLRQQEGHSSPARLVVRRPLRDSRAASRRALVIAESDLLACTRFDDKVDLALTVSLPLPPLPHQRTKPFVTLPTLWSPHERGAFELTAISDSDVELKMQPAAGDDWACARVSGTWRKADGTAGGSDSLRQRTKRNARNLSHTGNNRASLAIESVRNQTEKPGTSSSRVRVVLVLGQPAIEEAAKAEVGGTKRHRSGFTS